MKYYLESVDVVLKDLNTTGNGLSSAEAEKIRYRCLFLREMERDRKSVFIQKEDQKRH